MRTRMWSVIAGAAVGTLLGGPRNGVRGAILAKRLHDHFTGQDDGADDFASRIVEGHVNRK